MKNEATRSKTDSVTPWQWTRSRERAAVLLAEGLDAQQVAQKLRVGKKLIERWTQQWEFRQRVEQNTVAFRERFLTQGLARKEARVAALTDVFERLGHAEVELSGEPQNKKVPVGTNGRVVCRPNSSREMRATLKQISQELGQWGEKHELTGTDGRPPQAVDLSVLSDEELRTYVGILEKLANPQD